jgi:branched-chain amino acid transport system permease protein
VDKFLNYSVIGLTTAAIYAIAASGLVVTYSTSGIFNFAHGAFGMLAAFLFWQLHFDWGWPTPIALLVVLAIAAPLFGAGVERVIMRGLQDVSEVVKISVTVSLMLACMGLARWIWPPDVNRPVTNFFGDNHVTIFGVNVTYHQLLSIAVAVGVAVFLRWFLYSTRTGVEMRAVVDDRSLARLNGSRPDRAAMIAWAIGTALAAISGILNAPYQSLSVDLLTLLIINAYAAAIVGRLRNLPMTFVGALILGLAEAYAIGYLGSIDPSAVSGSGIVPTIGRWLLRNASNVRVSMPAILLFIVLLLLPQERLRAVGVRRSRETVSLPTASSALVGAVLLVAFTIGVAPMFASADLIYFAQALAYGLIVLSLVPLIGLGGQISIAQLSFAGLGVVAFGRFGVFVSNHDLNPAWTLVGIVLAALLSSLVGTIVALPALRLQGIYLALATGAFAVIAYNFVFNQQSIFPNGSLDIPRVHIPGLSFDGDVAYTVLLAVAFALFGLLVVVIRGSRFGRRLQAMKDSPVACATLGLDLTRTKLSVFALSAALAGVSGALYAALFRVATPNDFTLVQSLPITMIAVVGGVGAVGGALIGGSLLASFGVMQTVFGTNAIGFFKLFEGRLLDVVKPLPGLMGVSLGRDPNGIVEQVAVGYRPLGRSRRSAAIAVAVGALLIVLARVDAIDHWSLALALIAWVAGGALFLPAIIDPAVSCHRVRGATFIAAAVGLLAFGNWDGWVASNGYRVLVGVAAVAGLTLVTPRLLFDRQADTQISPDYLGLTRPLESDDAERADLVLGIRDEVVNGVAASR